MRIVQDPLCPICGLVAETIGYIIWSCSSSTNVWVDCNRKIQNYSGGEDYFLSILEELMERLDNEDLELVAMVARRIWLQRNTMAHRGELLYHSHLVRSTKEYVEEFQKA